MKTATVLGVFREPVFSPGKIEDDAAIMQVTLETLSTKGCTVRSLHAAAMGWTVPRFDFVLTMAQSQEGLAKLEKWSRHGTKVINTVSSVRNCYRKPLTHLLSKAGIGIPTSRMVTLEEAEEKINRELPGRLWLKRGDVHAIEPGDVASVTSREELDSALAHFRDRHIRDILIQEHVNGPVVKFYGVGQGAFFKAYVASTGEELTSPAESLKAVARQAARAVGLEIFGGDAVLTEEKGAVLIDLNDWPSFSRCCHSAAASIAAYVHARFI
jgi:glutathione synthase/RimK-type ligase-like ATP-grasp enzyme